MSVSQVLSNFIWNEKLWFPTLFAGQHYGWKDLVNTENSNQYFPQLSDIHFCLVLGVGLIVLRYMLSRFVFAPLGYRLGVIKHLHQHQSKSPFLDAAFKQKWNGNNNDIFIRKAGEKTIANNKKEKEQRLLLDKFCKSGWLFTFYTSMVIYGLFVLWDKSWFRETRRCFDGWPKQDVSLGLYWYYMIELAFYWSLLITVFLESKKVHFIETVVHHIAALVLLYFSWATNNVRFGSLVLITHDISDPFLELAKICTYLKKKKTADVIFTLFVISWIVTELFVIPYYVLYVTTFVYFEYTNEVTLTYMLLNFFLYVELLLVIMWSYHMYKWVRAKLKKEPEQHHQDHRDKKDPYTPGKCATTHFSFARQTGS